MTAVAAKAPHMIVAETLLEQLGGRRFLLFTGARDLLGLSAYADECILGGLQFSLPTDITRDGINRIRITLDASDTYKIEAMKANFDTYTVDVVASRDGVYFDMLEEVFTDLTGVFTRL